MECRWWDSNPHVLLAQGILSPPRLPFRHTGVFCCMNNIDIIADSSPKIKMQLATRQISANFLSPFGLRACIPEETHHDRRSFFMGRSTSRTGRAAGRGLLCRINSRQISGFFPPLFFRMTRRASHKSRPFLFSLCIFLVLSEFGPRLAGQSR